MKLTDEQLQEIADKGAEAAYQAGGQATITVSEKVYPGCWKADAPARDALTRTVIDLALSKMAESEWDLVTEEEGTAQSFVHTHFALVNSRHKQMMAALRAHLTSKGEEVTQSLGVCMMERDQWKERAEKAEAELAKSEKGQEELMTERDNAEEAMSQAYYLVIGRSPEWSNAFGYNEAHEEIEEVVTSLKGAASNRQAAEKELAALKQQAPTGLGVFDALEAIAKYDSGNGCCPYGCDCPTIAKAALAHKPQPWIPCAQRLPTREDGDVRGEVLWNWTSLNEVVARKWNWAHRTSATHWMPIPPLPTAPTAEKVPSCPKCHGDGYVEIQSGPYNRPCPLCKPAIPQGGESIDAIDQAPQEKVPTPPEPPTGMHIADAKERLCLPAGSLLWLSGYWGKAFAIGHSVASNCIYACPNTPALVTFTPEGKINPPPYGSWHRSDWTPEMLPDGWRPLLLGEKRDCEMLMGTRWQERAESTLLGGPAANHHYHMRTRRPLPPAPEKEKEPEWVPLEACDVPPGSAIRSRTGGAWGLVLSCGPTGMCIYGIPPMVGYDLAFKEWQISRDNGKTWEPCKKIKQP